MDPYASLGFMSCFSSSCNPLVQQRPSFIASQDAHMPQVGTATILPRVNQSDPGQKSEVSISIQAGLGGVPVHLSMTKPWCVTDSAGASVPQDDMTGDVFLCSLGATKCVAHMRDLTANAC